MELFHAKSTCSMSELGQIPLDYPAENYARDFKTSLETAASQNRQAIFANLDASQYRNKTLVEALEKAGFHEIGTYRGNPGTVHIFLKGRDLCLKSK